MRSFIGISLIIAGLTACASTQPNDGDQYFDNAAYDPAAAAVQAEEDRLARAELLPETVRPPEETLTATTTTIEARPVTTTQTNGTLVTTLPATTPSPTPTDSISNAEDFDTIKERETIQSDAAKLTEWKKNYEIVEPEATPTRTSDVNLAKYALAQTNPVGQKVHSRFSLNKRKYRRKCGLYSSADEAQTDLIRAGGPQKDPLGIDPDGDGYACGWSPEAYRSLIGQ